MSSTVVGGVMLCLLGCVLGAHVAMVAGSLSRPQVYDLLRLHNRLRSDVSPTPCQQLRPLVWSLELAQVAQRYASSCNWEHNPRRSTQATKFARVGENLAYSTATRDSVLDLVQAWYDEIDDYTLSTNQCHARPCGHFTQIVWNTTTHVGCGMHVCPTSSTKHLTLNPRQYPQVLILVCNYGPAGNWAGRAPYSACSGSGRLLHAITPALIHTYVALLVLRAAFQ
ncbi:peptidase inhibitor 15-like [Sycon ciliatum]|uniref:peptidase inhibitor 15-like n=1 Tax=Sycon ciliatum TaxID=27933 RepID=UPI0020AC6DAA|eukprot:scpid85175/ scgid17033/ Peptidase inhibitor 15